MIIGRHDIFSSLLDINNMISSISELFDHLGGDRLVLIIDAVQFLALEIGHDSIASPDIELVIEVLGLVHGSVVIIVWLLLGLFDVQLQHRQHLLVESGLGEGLLRVIIEGVGCFVGISLDLLSVVELDGLVFLVEGGGLFL